MEIDYLTTQSFEQNQLQRLFLSVGWSSGHYPKELQAAIKNADKMISACDGKRVVGLMHTVSDVALTAYFQYLLVQPDYQAKGIG